MTIDVTQTITESVAQTPDHFMRGVAIRADVASVLDERDLGVGRTEDVIAVWVDGAIEPLCS